MLQLTTSTIQPDSLYPAGLYVFIQLIRPLASIPTEFSDLQPAYPACKQLTHDCVSLVYVPM